MWDIESGKCVFEFSNAHGDTGITAMTFDSTERRYVHLITMQSLLSLQLLLHCSFVMREFWKGLQSGHILGNIGE